MKTKFFLLAIGIIIAIGVKAQKGIDTGTPYGSGADSVRCVENISLFSPYARSNNFKDAYPYWKAVYDECPGSNLNIYILGASIINWQISEEKDPAKRDALIDDMMQLYDNRIKYFGNDPRTKKDNVIARKVISYNELKGENSDYQLMYKWLKEAVDEFGENTDPQAVSRFIFTSIKLLQSDLDKYKEQYINDFVKCSGIYDAQLKAAQAANNEKVIEILTSFKTEMEQNFAVSGAADCESLEKIYAAKVEENKTDIEFLKKTLSILSKVRCNETDVYLAASEYAYKIAPTAESAMGLGSKAVKNNEMATAEKYFNEAIEMSDDSNTKAILYYTLAKIANSKGQYAQVKQLCIKCLAENPNEGDAYILWANAYAAGGRSLFDDPVLAKCVFYAVVDKLEKARQVDPSVAADAARQINKYSQYFPSKEEIFMHPSIKAGENFQIPGWINETVRVR